MGAEPRDLSRYSEWREQVDEIAERMLDLYGTYLVGQTSGLSEALSLEAVVAMLRIEAFPERQWPAATQLLLIAHAEIMGLVKARARGKKHHG